MEWLYSLPRDYKVKYRIRRVITEAYLNEVLTKYPELINLAIKIVIIEFNKALEDIGAGIYKLNDDYIVVLTKRAITSSVEDFRRTVTHELIHLRQVKEGSVELDDNSIATYRKRRVLWPSKPPAWTATRIDSLRLAALLLPLETEAYLNEAEPNIDPALCASYAILPFIKSTLSIDVTKGIFTLYTNSDYIKALHDAITYYYEVYRDDTINFVDFGKLLFNKYFIIFFNGCHTAMLTQREPKVIARYVKFTLYYTEAM